MVSAAATPAPARVLVVDDDATSRIMMKSMLGKFGYAVDVADGLATARKVLSDTGTEAYSALITDYWMPGGTGLELLRYVQSLDQTLATVIVTAEGEKELVANLLREGANNFLDKPVQTQQLRETVTRANEATLRDRRLRAAAQAARNLGASQLYLLQQHTTAFGERLEIFYQPHNDAGGDFVTAVPLDAGRIVLLASDVSGHDLKAAYQSIYFHGMARGLMEGGAPLAEVFRKFNQLLLTTWNQEGSIELSLSAFGACIDLNAGSLETLNCGFPIPLLGDAAGWPRPQGEEFASPLGWFDALPEITGGRNHDHQLCFWSDGVEDLAGKLGVDPLSLTQRLVHQSRDPAALLARAEDDIVAAVLDLRTAGRDQPLPQPLMHQRYRGDQLGEIDRIQEFCDRSLRLALPPVGEPKLADLLLCLREALINGLLHGCQKSAERQATLQVVHDPAGGCVRIRITDEGTGHDFDAANHEIAAAEQMLTEHRGLVLIRNLPNRTEFSDRGSTVTMEFTL